MGGVWGESGFAPRDFRPFAFGADETSISIPGNGQGELSNWTILTRKAKAVGEPFDCPATGCTQGDWRRPWDFNGWNQIRLKV